MQAIELQAVIDKDHKIHLQLPKDWPLQTVKVIVLLEEPSELASTPEILERDKFRGNINLADDFNAELPDDFWLSKDVPEV